MSVEQKINVIKAQLAELQRPGTLGADPSKVVCGTCEIIGLRAVAIVIGCVAEYQKKGPGGFDVFFAEPDGTKHQVAWYRTGSWMVEPCSCGRREGT